MRLITSDANSAFRRWLKLASQPRALRELARTLAEGTHLVKAVLDAGIRIESLIARRGARSPEVETLMELVGESRAPAFELAPALFDRLSPVQSSVGLILEIAVPFGELTATIAEDAIYLDGIQDPGNAGALLRVAAAAGVRCALAAPGTAALWSPRTLRAAQGAHFALKLIEGVTAAMAGRALVGSWIAAVAHDASPLWTAALPTGPIGWVLGAEGQGVSEAMLAQCGQRVRVPLAQGVESLNVAAAAAICLFERRRRLDLSQ
jgi:TrmH family RNA methyltransferase